MYFIKYNIDLQYSYYYSRNVKITIILYKIIVIFLMILSYHNIQKEQIFYDCIKHIVLILYVIRNNIVKF